ncbi:MAG: hypothetical protein ACXVBX_16380, partial [Flavisolibacter sp.]
GTAEELAADEQVKKLYLGRNFELKRKEWILEDAGKNKLPDIQSLIKSLENGVEWFNRLENDYREAEQEFGRGFKDSDGNLQIRDYKQYLGELKALVWSFLDKHPDRELKAKLNQWESDATVEQAVHDLNTILLLLKSKA